MADEKIEIPVTIEGAEKAARDLETINKSIAALKSQAERSSAGLREMRGRTQDLGTQLYTARRAANETKQSLQNLANVTQVLNNLQQLANAAGAGPTSVAGSMLSAASAGAGFGSMLGPVGTAAGAATGAIYALARSFSDLEANVIAGEQRLAAFQRMTQAGINRRQSIDDARREAAAVLEVDAATRRGASAEEINTIRRRQHSESIQDLVSWERQLATDRENNERALRRENLSEAERARLMADNARVIEDINGATRERVGLIAEAVRLTQSETSAVVAETARIEAAERARSARGGRSGNGIGTRAQLADQEYAARAAAMAENIRKERELAEAIVARFDEEQRVNEASRSNLLAKAEEQRSLEEELRTLANDRRSFEIERLSEADELVGLRAEERDILAEMNSLRNDAVPDSQQMVRLGRLNLRLDQNRAEAQEEAEERLKAQLASLKEMGSTIGGVFGEAYDEAINSSVKFDAALAWSAKKVLQQLGTEYVAKGAGAMFESIGYFGTQRYDAGAAKLAEGAGLIGLGLGLGGIASAIPPRPDDKKKEKPEEPDKEGGEESIQRTVVINFNSPVVTAGTRRQLGDQMSSLIRSGSRS